MRRAAFVVDKILKGAKPADMPVERPNMSELVVNLKAARVLGITIPAPFLLLAEGVIQVKPRRLKIGVVAFPMTRGVAD